MFSTDLVVIIIIVVVACWFLVLSCCSRFPLGTVLEGLGGSLGRVLVVLGSTLGASWRVLWCVGSLLDGWRGSFKARVEKVLKVFRISDQFFIDFGMILSLSLRVISITWEG